MIKILRMAALGLIVFSLVSSILGSNEGAEAQTKPASIFPTSGTDGPGR